VLTLLVAVLGVGCGDDGAQGVSVSKMPDAGAEPDEGQMIAISSPCDDVEVDGDVVIEHEKDFTARFRVGEPYTKTVMLFGGERVEDENALSNAYIFGLDKTDALMLAEKYPDFYLCSSPGGMEASSYIVPYDLVPATCEVYEQIVAALRQYSMNLASGGDRTSLRFDGAPLELESVTADANGADVTDQITDQDFHLVTAVEQLSGESVISFGTME
jgi:hypothetical protein